jgi:hypothetical protein
MLTHTWMVFGFTVITVHSIARLHWFIVFEIGKYGVGKRSFFSYGVSYIGRETMLHYTEYADNKWKFLLEYNCNLCIPYSAAFNTLSKVAFELVMTVNVG